MKDIIAILLLTIAWIIAWKLWKRTPHEESIEAKSFRNQLTCDDNCFCCPAKSWCTFSEVRIDGKKTSTKHSANSRG